MASRTAVLRRIGYVFWILALVAIATTRGLNPVHAAGWDLQVYANAIQALRAGHDPYADGIAVQRAFHATLALHPTAMTPFTYVYSPLTLPLLKWVAMFPFKLSGIVYWAIYWLGLFAAIWVGMQAVEASERHIFALLAPCAAFYPGLLHSDVLYSGNVAYILYGLVFAAALLGWRRGTWVWFYIAVLAASCCKAPLLTLLAIPVLSARKQWFAAAATGAAGLAIFAAQPTIWPGLFHNYLTAVELQFSYNHDFGCSPAGLVADVFYDSIPYTITTAVFYLIYAVPVFLILLYLRRDFLAGRISLRQWMPVVSVGAILMNPRIMEYDVAPVAVPMALIAWRFFARNNSLQRTMLEMGLYLIAGAGFALNDWRSAESMVIVSVFAAGAWNLFQQSRDAERHPVGAFEVEHIQPRYISES